MTRFQRLTAYVIVTALVTGVVWRLTPTGSRVVGLPLLAMGAPLTAGKAPTPVAPVPRRELPTPPEPPMELYARLEGVRLSSDEHRDEAVLIFTHPLNYQMEAPAPLDLQLLLYPIDRESLKSQTTQLTRAGYTVEIDSVSRFAYRLKLRSPGTRQVRIPEAAQGRTRSLVLRFDSVQPADHSAGRHERGRLVLRSSGPVAPGLTLRRLSWTSRSGQHSTLNVLELDPAIGQLRLGLAVGEPVLNRRTLLTEMARRAGAVAALNASYFSMSGDPLGLLIDRGRVISAPIYERSSFGVHQQRRFLFGNPEFSGRIRVSGTHLPVAALNEKREDGKVVVFTPEFGESTRTQTEGIEVAVAGSRVVGTGTNNLWIPKEGIVISVHGRDCALLADLAVGDQVTYEYGVTPPWSLCDLAVGGGPRLVKDGVPMINAAEERFDRNFAREKAPRSAVGTTRTGKLMMVAVDGRHPPRNAGVTLAEAAQIMLDLGCVQAMNLDGGGSTTMVVKGRILNSPSDGREREVSTGILVLPADSRLAALRR